MTRSRVAARVVERAVVPVRDRSAREVDQLLDAAGAVLRRSGFSGLRVEEVLAEAGLSNRAFYRHFRGKSELFLALFEQESDRAAERLESLVARAPDPEAKVRAWVRAVLALAYDPRVAARTRLFAREEAVMAAEFPDETGRCVERQLAPLESAIADGVATGVFPAADPARDARAIHHLCAGLMTDRLAERGALGREQAMALAAGFALQALSSDGTGRRP
jgi:AcrR family transcriptional regulator